MSSPPPPTVATTELTFSCSHVVDDHCYTVTVSTDSANAGTVVLDLLGAGPDAVVSTEGRLAVHTDALGHLGLLFSQVFDGLAALHGPGTRPKPTTRKRQARRRGHGLPTNSHQKWTDDQRNRLEAAWVAADPQATVDQVIVDLSAALGVKPAVIQERLGDIGANHDPATVIAVIAHAMKRTDLAIRSQLERQHLDPDRPGPPAASSRTIAP